MNRQLTEEGIPKANKHRMTLNLTKNKVDTKTMTIPY